jgi:DNA-binding MarR family transcriptional regulator
MASQLQHELKQTKPFTSLEQEALLSIARTAAQLTHAMGELLKSQGITLTQYNVLRILRGQGGEALCRNEVRDRLIAEGPDVTRLLDRMEEAGLVRRERDSEDRRLVNTTISRDGTRLLERLEKPVAALQVQLLGHLGKRKLALLVDLLAEVRRPS